MINSSQMTGKYDWFLSVILRTHYYVKTMNLSNVFNCPVINNEQLLTDLLRLSNKLYRNDLHVT